jgi:dephospho-CoA kinase
MKVYGVTGGVGMGKSTTDQFLRDRGLLVVDTDVLARQLVEPGQPALAEIRKTFGDAMISNDGHLRREELARLVFGDVAERNKLESILHPRIRAVWQKQIETWRAQNRSRAAVIIPLLFETGAASAFDATICVACSVATQRNRLLARGWDVRQIEQRIEAQWPVEKKMELSNYVVWTEGSMEVHEAQLDRILKNS